MVPLRWSARGYSRGCGATTGAGSRTKSKESSFFSVFLLMRETVLHSSCDGGDKREALDVLGAEGVV